MKYWRGFLVAFIFAAITWGLNLFAAGHTALVDMVYPYVSRLAVGSIAQWSSGIGGCLWQTLLLILVLGIVASLVLVLLFKRNPIRWLGWVLAIACGIHMGSTLLYGLNKYASPVSEDARLVMTDYTVSELVEATKYYRDQANNLATSVKRNEQGELALPEFEELAQMAGQGFHAMTYDHAISLFAGTTVPVKKLGWTIFYGGTSGVTVPLTGEACVNPNTPSVALPFAMCKEMAKRMTVSREEDAKYAAFLAAEANESDLFRYSAYCIAYYHCYHTLAAVSTSTAQQATNQMASGVNPMLKADLDRYEKFFGEFKDAAGDSFADMLTAKYIELFITPLHVEQEDPFDPKDPSKVDLSYVKPTPSPLKEPSRDEIPEETEPDDKFFGDEELDDNFGDAGSDAEFKEDVEEDSEEDSEDEEG